MNTYQEHGYKDRADYLACLAEDHGVDVRVVEYIADLLGEQEDFDALVTNLDSWSQLVHLTQGTRTGEPE